MKLLITACAILIGGFGARRIGEVTSLRAGCLIEGKPGLCELTVYVEKTLRDTDRIPVPALFRRVIEVLERASASTRAATGKDWLFEIIVSPYRKRGRLHLPFHDLLDDFARVNRLPLPEGWSEWSLSAHQLRRGFAICYYHGFQAASLDALSRFLRHFDPDMTRVYINEVVSGSMGRLRDEIQARTKTARTNLSVADKEWISNAKQALDALVDRGSLFEETRCEALVHRMLSLWDGSDAAIGRGAAKLYGDLSGMVDKASAQVRVTSRSNSPDGLRQPLTSLLQEYAKTHYLEPVPGHAAHCTLRPGDEDDLAQAECLKAKASHRTPWSPTTTPAGDSRPDHAFSNAFVCLSCAHCASFKDSQQVVANAIGRLEQGVALASSAPAKSAAAAKLARLKAAVQMAKNDALGRA